MSFPKTYTHVTRAHTTQSHTFLYRYMLMWHGMEMYMNKNCWIYLLKFWNFAFIFILSKPYNSFESQFMILKSILLGWL